MQAMREQAPPILLVDELYGRNFESNDSKHLYLFPSCFGEGGVAFTRQELLKRSKHLHVAGEALSQQLFRVMGTYISDVDLAYYSYIRIAMVPMVHFFVDRFTRLYRLAEKDANFVVGMPEQDVPHFQRIEEFTHTANASPEFNQFFICAAAQALGLKTKAMQARSERKANLPFLNANFLNFAPSARSRVTAFWGKLRMRVGVFISRKTGRTPAVSMSTGIPYFMKNGFYGSGRWIYEPTQLLESMTSTKDEELRSKIFRDILPEAEKALRPLFPHEEFAKVSFSELVCTFLSLCSTCFPSHHLERFSDSRSMVARIFRRCRSDYWVFGDCGFNYAQSLLISEAKRRGALTVGYQHGGQYGYSLDLAFAEEGEYPNYDAFLTWGWSDMPRSSTFRTLKFIPLPSPWLSERRIQWASNLRARNEIKNKPYDIIFMPNKIHRYPMPPSGASLCLIDYIQDLSRQMLELVSKTADANCRMFIKPFNPDYLELMKPVFDQLEPLSGKFFDVGFSNQKGITPDLMNLGELLLWELPSTGFLEALAVGIPTMVLWERIYSSEMEEAKPIFESLEQVGVVHSNVESLLAEVKRFKVSPSTWIANSERQAAIRKCSERYGRVAPDWIAQWWNFFGELDRLGSSRPALKSMLTETVEG